MSQFRVYFYNLETRKEMTEFKGNGKTWLQTSGMKRDDNGNFIQDSAEFVVIADYATFRDIKGELKVTAKDFDFPVAVKIWYGPENIEWRKLI